MGVGLGWVLCANSHPREAACLGPSPTGCRRQSEHSDPGPEARGRSSKTREWPCITHYQLAKHFTQ